MLKRLCQDQLKQWHRLINPVLFEYREVPQESTGFSPFQLLYGHLVRGPGTILKVLSTKEVNIPEVNTSYEDSQIQISGSRRTSTNIASVRQKQVINAVEKDHTLWRVMWEPTTTEFRWGPSQRCTT